MSSSFASGMADTLLGPPGRQRVRASQSLLALAAYTLFAAVLQAATAVGQLDFDDWSWLPATYLTGALLFYAAIRSGVNLRMVSDPSLTVPQTVFGMLVCAGAYGVTGPVRGAVILLPPLILVFAMFAMRPAQSRALAVFVFLLLGAVMVWKARTDPARYPTMIEAVHIVSIGIVLTCVSVLSTRMSAMRERLKSQKLALESALERIGQLATRDELTGLVNRRHMGALVRTEQLRQQRTEPKMTIVLIDIDLFKRINDSHGHQAGDTVLKAFAAVSTEVLRGADVLARWGGEEFLLMLPGTRPEQALHSVERLRQALARTSFDAIAPGLKVTFSAGLSACADDDLIEACIERADQAMYRAKTKGRDCSVLA